jgi:3-deoxy-manno-octulosonate cytidylyltransferase (CMP-KDO synthetase)
MVWWVYNQALKVPELDEVYVATEDERIKKVCEDLGCRVLMTADTHATGTDRTAEAAGQVRADLYINIQGDEPIIEPETIARAVHPFADNPNLQVSNLMSEIRDPVELHNFTVPKVIANREGRGIFLTRSPAPYPKGRIDHKYYKQVCVYGFRPQALEFFASSPRGMIEEIEDIEILRFIENDIKVQFVEVASRTIAVDTPNDLEKVRAYIDLHNIQP